jgi:7-cyano-7-deazaguanine synthase
VVDVQRILRGRSPLVNPAQALETYTDFASIGRIIRDQVEPTFVPMRKLLFLVLAANRAICAGIRDLVTDVCQADNANYPGCQGSFIASTKRATSEMLGLDKPGMGPDVRSTRRGWT